MTGPKFFETRMGQRFYEGTVPKLVGALERIATALEIGNGEPVLPGLADLVVPKKTEPPRKTARSHARGGGKLDGADAQALEGALQLTEEERDEAREQLARRNETIKSERDLSEGLRRALGALADEAKYTILSDEQEQAEHESMEDMASSLGYPALAHALNPEAYPLEVCEHEWVSGDNEVVSGAEVCTKCKEIRTAPTPKKVDPVQELLRAAKKCLSSKRGFDHDDELDAAVEAFCEHDWNPAALGAHSAIYECTRCGATQRKGR